MSSRDDLHALLPWYANGTLPADEKLSFDEHLRGCEECRRELSVLRELGSAVEQHGQSYFEEHPSVEELVDAIRGDSDPDRIRETRRHLALCRTCSAEAGVVQPPDEASVGRARSSNWIAWATAAASVALLAIGFLVLEWRPDRPSGALSTHFIEAQHRGTTGDTVQVPAGARDFQLVLHLDFDRPSGPVEYEVSTADGLRVVAGTARPTSSGYLFLYCRRKDFPDGRYVAIARAADGEAESECRFELRTEGSR